MNYVTHTAHREAMTHIYHLRGGGEGVCGFHRHVQTIQRDCITYDVHTHVGIKRVRLLRNANGQVAFELSIFFQFVCH